ncbi:MAG: histidinol dehydrogenase [Polyangiaceae bacterium]|nr:histidinol dehydrogenase [Polyangiaceae bacterium]
MILPTIQPGDLKTHRAEPLGESTLQAAARIVEDVKQRGFAAVVEHSIRLGDTSGDEPLILDKNALEKAFLSLPESDRALLERTRDRIQNFALSQKKALSEIAVPVGGGRAGHEVIPVERAGCYAPGGRFPLPSSVLMTAVTARAAGVREVWVASPRPAPVTLAAAHVAGADALLAVGGAQAIAALAFGAGEVPACDAIVGPGNRWVTAAKQYVAGLVTIDMLAGPSELVVLADGNADPALVAADLLAQAEHDTDALPVLVSLDSTLPDRVRAELHRQLETLPTHATARESLSRGFALVEPDIHKACAIVEQIAPEHLQILLPDPGFAADHIRHAGALFLGPKSAEVLGDYGAGPNHVLPTSRGARSRAGLSIFTFLRIRTWMELDNPAEVARDAAALARLEGLEAHARAAEMRARQ